TVTMVRLGKTYGNLMVDLRSTNEKLRARSRRIVEMATGAGEEAVDGALAETGGDVKAAILTLLGGVGAEEAARLIAESGGRLRGGSAAPGGGCAAPTTPPAPARPAPRRLPGGRRRDLLPALTPPRLQPRRPAPPGPATRRPSAPAIPARAAAPAAGPRPRPHSRTGPRPLHSPDRSRGDPPKGSR